MCVATEFYYSKWLFQFRFRKRESLSVYTRHIDFHLFFLRNALALANLLGPYNQRNKIKQNIKWNDRRAKNEKNIREEGRKKMLSHPFTKQRRMIAFHVHTLHRHKYFFFVGGHECVLFSSLPIFAVEYLSVLESTRMNDYSETIEQSERKSAIWAFRPRYRT